MPPIHATMLQDITFEGEYAAIPMHMREAIMNYVVKRYELGGFLTAVICNDLKGAVNRADRENLPLLRLYVLWFHNVCPSNLVGRENYLAHINRSSEEGGEV